MSRRGWTLFAALSLIWGIPYLLIKVAVDDISPAVLVFTRTALAAGLLLPIAIARGELRKVLTHWRWVLLFAAVEISVPFWMLGFAEQRLTSSLAGLLVAAVPLVSAGLARALALDARLDRTRLIGLVVGLAGVAALMGLDLGSGDLPAVAAMAMVVLGYATGPIVISTRLAGVPSLGVVAAALTLVAFAYAPAAVADWPRAPVPGTTWLAVAVLGLACTALAFLALFALVAEVGPARTTVITYVNPAVAVLMGVAILGEPVTTGLLVGFPLILAGSYLGTRRTVAPTPA